MVNKAILVGRLGRDPELRYTGKGTAVASFSLATSEKFNGEEKTTWHQVVTWAKTAEVCSEYLSKGSLVYVEGRISIRKYTDREGQEKTAFEIVADTVRFLQTNRDGGSGKGAARQSSPPEFPGIGADDIPF